MVQDGDKITAAAYVRVAPGDDLGERKAEIQRAVIRKYAARRGLIIPDEYWFIDECSGLKGDRPGLQQVLRLSRERKIQAVLVSHLSALHRYVPTLIRVIRALDKDGVEVVPILEGPVLDAFLDAFSRAAGGSLAV